MPSDFENEHAGGWLVQTTRFWGNRKIRLSCKQWPKAIEDVLGYVGTKKLAHLRGSENGVITHVVQLWLKSGSTMQFEFHYVKSDSDGAVHLIKDSADIKLELI